MQTLARLDIAAEERALELFQDARENIYRQTDRLFANLMVLQWLAGIAAALVISPRTWIGAASQTHWHVWAAVFLGGAITGFPVFLAWKHPGRVLTRQTVAVAQMLFSALLIHLTGGRVETHFHVFGSLAFLAIYRDWRVLVSATVVVAIDHCVRGLFWPLSVFGVVSASPWRWLEHAGWVVFEDTFLLISTRQSLRDMFEVASRRANLEMLNSRIEHQVEERTAQLTAAHQDLQRSEERFSSAFEHASIGMALVSPDGRWIKVNRALCRLIGYTAEELYERTFQDVTHPEDLELDLAQVRQMLAGEILSYQMEKRYFHKEGRVVWVLLSVSLIRDSQGRPVHFISQIQDITERKDAEAALDTMHKELLEASRRAGMAEVATSVLHNVGNVLNSVNVSCSVAAEKIRRSRIGSVKRTADLLDENAGDLAGFMSADPRGRKLPGFLRNLAGRLAGEQSEVLEELRLLAGNIDHIRQIVAMQQGYARVTGVTETVKVTDLVEDSLRMNTDALLRHEVEVVREYEEVPPITIDKHKAVQILVNLIRNAKQACDDSGSAAKRMTVRVTNSGGSVRVAVIDNGVGIPPENLTRIFAHGFTTKPDGHGFGLHGGALAARELGGTLSVHSDGGGAGATFTLELPVEPPGDPGPAT
jgi:PAS domain S-box-containing protein